MGPVMGTYLSLLQCGLVNIVYTCVSTRIPSVMIIHTTCLWLQIQKMTREMMMLRMRKIGTNCFPQHPALQDICVLLVYHTVLCSRLVSSNRLYLALQIENNFGIFKILTFKVVHILHSSRSHYGSEDCSDGGYQSANCFYSGWWPVLHSESNWLHVQSNNFYAINSEWFMARPILGLTSALHLKRLGLYQYQLVDVNSTTLPSWWCSGDRLKFYQEHYCPDYREAIITCRWHRAMFTITYSHVTKFPQPFLVHVQCVRGDN